MYIQVTCNYRIKDIPVRRLSRRGLICRGCSYTCKSIDTQRVPRETKFEEKHGASTPAPSKRRFEVNESDFV